MGEIKMKEAQESKPDKKYLKVLNHIEVSVEGYVYFTLYIIELFCRINGN